MKVKDLIERLQRFDEESEIAVYNLSYTDCRFNLYFDIYGLYSNENNVTVMEIKHTGECIL